MRTYRRLSVRLSKRDREELRQLLRRGFQPVRTTLRALTLIQLDAGQSASQVAANVLLNIRCRKSLTDRYGESKGGQMWSRLTVHPTPKHGNWLNQAEIELSLYSLQCLGTWRIPALKTLQRETRSWKRRVNRAQVTINWKFHRRAVRKNLTTINTHPCGRRPSPIFKYATDIVQTKFPCENLTCFQN